MKKQDVIEALENFQNSSERNAWVAAYERCDENIKSIRDRGFGEVVDIVDATTSGHPSVITLIDSLASGTDEQLREFLQVWRGSDYVKQSVKRMLDAISSDCLKRQEVKAMFDYEHSTIRTCKDGTVYIESGEIRHVYFDGVFAYAYNFVNPVWE